MKINLKLTALVCLAATITANAMAVETTDTTGVDTQQLNYTAAPRKDMIVSKLSADLLNIPVGSERSVDLILTNSTMATRENLRIEYDQYIPYTPPSGMSLLSETLWSNYTDGTFCQQGQKLEPNKSCAFRIIFRPNQATSGAIAFVIRTRTPSSPDITIQRIDGTGPIKYSSN